MSGLHLNELVYKSRKHILEMVKDRGFDVKKLEEYTVEEMVILLEQHKKGSFEVSSNLSALDIIVENSSTKRKLVIKYRLDNKFKKVKSLLTQIDEIYNLYELTKNDCLIIMNLDILLFRDEANKNSNKALEAFINEQYNAGKFVQFFGLENFLFNISKHIYVPKHTIVPKADVVDIIADFNTKLENMPKIYREDPMAKYIGARPGDLVKIKGYIETTGFIDKYRLCIE